MRVAKYKYFLALMDFFSFLIILLITSQFVFSKDHQSIVQFSYNHPISILTFFLSSILFVFILQSNNLYKVNFFLVTSLHLTYLVKSLIVTWIGFILIAFILKQSILLDSRLFIFYGSIASLFFLGFIRIIIIERILFKNFSARLLKSRILIYGAGKNGRILATKFSFENPYGIEVVGFIDDNKELNGKSINGYQVFGDINKLETIIVNNKVDKIVLAIENTDYDNLIRLIEICKALEVNVKIASNLFEVIPQKMVIEKFAGIPLINVSPQIKSKYFFLVKRLIDIVGAIVGIILLSPILLIVSILVKLSSPGPIIISQVRIGKNGTPFKFYKFRSMKVVPPEVEEKRKKEMVEFIKTNKTNGNGDTKVIDMNRLTKVGKFIRKTSIDELPQLINVIKGDMSLVGPRPCLPYEYENLEEWQKKRFDVLPGCTGVWQVMGRSNVNYKESVIMDLYYVNNITPWLDLQLIIKTIPVMIFGRGGK